MKKKIEQHRPNGTVIFMLDGRDTAEILTNDEFMIKAYLERSSADPKVEVILPYQIKIPRDYVNIKIPTEPGNVSEKEE